MLNKMRPLDDGDTDTKSVIWLPMPYGTTHFVHVSRRPNLGHLGLQNVRVQRGHCVAVALHLCRTKARAGVDVGTSRSFYCKDEQCRRCFIPLAARPVPWRRPMQARFEAAAPFPLKLDI